MPAGDASIVEKSEETGLWFENLRCLGWDGSHSGRFENANSGDIPARVAREEKNLYLVLTAEGELLASVSGGFMNRGLVPGDYPKVGDWVAVSPRFEEGRGTIQEVLPRRNFISRKEPWMDTAEQIIAANVDKVFVVSALDEDFSPRRIERYLAIAYESGAVPVVVLNKADLCSDPDARLAAASQAAPGCPVHLVSAMAGEGLSELRALLSAGETAVFLGSSGVGKSTLINRFLGTERQAVKEVREYDGKGRHATTKRELIILPGGGIVIDSPGMREIQLWDDSDGLGRAFSDIEENSRRCRFSDCRHEAEPGCAVKAAIESGELDRKRFENFLKLKKETRRMEMKKEEKARRVAKAAARRSRGGRKGNSPGGWR